MCIYFKVVLNFRSRITSPSPYSVLDVLHSSNVATLSLCAAAARHPISNQLYGLRPTAIRTYTVTAQAVSADSHPLANIPFVFGKLSDWLKLEVCAVLSLHHVHAVSAAHTRKSLKVSDVGGVLKGVHYKTVPENTAKQRYYVGYDR